MWHSGNVSWFGHVSGRHLDRKVNRDTSSLQRKRQSQVGNSKYRLKYRSIRSEKRWRGVTNDFKADSRIKRRRGKRCRRLEEQSTLMQRKKSRRRYCGIIRQLVLIKRKQRQRAQSNVFFSPKERRNACGSDDKDIFFFFVLIRKGRGKNSSRTDFRNFDDNLHDWKKNFFECDTFSNLRHYEKYQDKKKGGSWM